MDEEVVSATITPLDDNSPAPIKGLRSGEDFEVAGRTLTMRHSVSFFIATTADGKISVFAMEGGIGSPFMVIEEVREIKTALMAESIMHTLILRHALGDGVAGRRAKDMEELSQTYAANTAVKH